ncbi:MAG TPA: amino acid ABC transporter permease [Candidatus Limnocylindrales bacterium]|nr:amino acid ABC transporter permease [Candidatus Limnocylindrales bacterium]
MTGEAHTTRDELRARRGSRLFGRMRPSGVMIATLSTLVVFGGIIFAVVNAPGFDRVQAAFFDPALFARSVPLLAESLWRNIQIFVIAEVAILVFALVLAVMRSLPGPVFFPFRLMAISYIEFFRAIPGILVIYLLALGVPGLRIPGLINEPFFWGIVALVLVWSAYVAEVYRAGIEAIHPSQEAAARSLGLSRVQGLRFVVLPQAIRRVVPPLLNDFIGLQKDTALVSFVGVVEIFRRSQIIAGGAFNFTPYIVCALFFLLLTIPTARLVDYFASRDRTRKLGGVGGVGGGSRRGRLLGSGPR